MGKITLVAVFYNEEQKLGGYFRNVRGVADRMVVVDCSSTDRTAQICKKNGALVVRSPYRYFEQNVNRALGKVGEGEWVLILDADERLSQELKAELRAAARGGGADVFFIRRINYIFGGFSRASTINTFLPRLFKKGCVVWSKEMPHEKPEIRGATARLSSLFYHYAFTSVASYIQKMEEYLCSLPSEYARKGQAKVRISERGGSMQWLFGTHGLRRTFLYPPVIFLDHLFARRLILDGMRGTTFAACAAIYAFFEEAIYNEHDAKRGRGARIDWASEYPERGR